MATPISGQATVTAAGTAEQLADQGVGRFAIKALAGNTDVLVLGNDDAGDVTTSNGFELSAKEGIVFAGNMNELWADVAVSGEGYCWLRLQ